jgi:NADH dehydrogenase FAD-containing subunit
MDTDVAADALARLRETHTELAGAERVLIVGAGPVGLELAGEIKAVWPDKAVTVVDPATELVPGFEPAMRADLLRQLAGLGVELRLGAALAEQPPSEPGRLKGFTVALASGGDEVGADIWFRCYGVQVDSGYLGAALAGSLTPQGQLRVTERLNVGAHPDIHPNVYALGDLTDLPEAKMASYAMRHADVVARNIIAQVRGEEPSASYRPSPVRSLLLPLGPTGGVGQVPSPEDPLAMTALSAAAVSQYKGVDLFTGRFAALFGTA